MTKLPLYHERFLTRKAKERTRASTLAHYKNGIAAILRLGFSHLEIEKLTTADIANMRAALLDAGWSVKAARTALNSSFRAMVREARHVDSILETDPFDGLSPWPKSLARKATPFSEEDRDRIIANMPDDKSRSFVELLFYTGMRPTEACALRWDDVDLDTGFLFVTASLVKGERNAPKTTGSERHVTLLPEAKNALERLPGRSGYVFVNQYGRPFNSAKFRERKFKPVLDRLGISGRLYDCRHTFISWAVSRGCNLRWVAEHVGNSQVEIEKTYARFFTARIQEQVALLSAPASGPAGGDSRAPLPLPS